MLLIIGFSMHWQAELKIQGFCFVFLSLRFNRKEQSPTSTLVFPVSSTVPWNLCRHSGNICGMIEKILVLLDSSIKKLWDGLGYKRSIWNTLSKSPLDGMCVSLCDIWEVEVGGGMEVIKLIPGGGGRNVYTLIRAVCTSWNIPHTNQFAQNHCAALTCPALSCSCSVLFLAKEGGGVCGCANSLGSPAQEEEGRVPKRPQPYNRQLRGMGSS